MKQAHTVRNILHKKGRYATEGHIYLRVGIPGENAPELSSHGYKISAADWNAEDEIVKKSNKDANQINTAITARKNEIAEQLRNRAMSRDQVKELLAPKADGTVRGSFIKFYADFLKIQEKRVTPHYYAHLDIYFRQFRETMGIEMKFEDVTVAALEKYEMSLHKLAATTRHTKIKKLKEIINRAVKMGHIDYKQIAGYKWPTYKQPETHYLTLAQTETIWNNLITGKYDSDPSLRLIAAFFLVECYSGIRFSDWGKFRVETLINGEALKVRTTKTKTDVYLPFKTFPRLAKVVGYIRDNGLKFDLTEQATNRILKYTIGKELALPFPLTTHVGRHTCGTLLGAMNWPTRRIAKVLGITEPTANRYINAAGDNDDLLPGL